MKILFLKIGAIGDTLMTTPLIRQVRRHFPNALIHYRIGKHSRAVLDDNPNINKVISFEEKIFTERKIVPWLKQVKAIKKEKYDLIFVLDKHWIFNLTAKLAGVKKRIGFNRLGKGGHFLNKSVPYGAIRHDIYCYLDLAKAAEIPITYKDSQMDITISEADRQFAEEFWEQHHLTQKTIGFCPGGGKNPGQTFQGKILPVEKYIAVIKKVKHPVLLIGGPSDKNKNDEIIEECPKVVSAIGKSTLKQSAALLAKCAKVVCNDSGPMHLAAAVNMNVISIFGPVHPKRKAPLHKSSTYLWKAAHLYSAEDETYGTLQKKAYFKDITAEDILSNI